MYGFLTWVLRAFWILFRSFKERQIQQHASSLTYYTLLALVPMLALFLGIAQKLLEENAFEAWLFDTFPEQQDILHPLLLFAHRSLAQAKRGWIAAAGTGLFIWSALKILSHMEWALNQLWEIQEGRTLWRKFLNYSFLLILCPLLIFLTNGVEWILSVAGHTAAEIPWEGLPILFRLLLKGFSWAIGVGFFMLLYVFLPNTRVAYSAALVGGIWTTITYHLLQIAYFYFQKKVSGYNAIYGTFAALPLFLLWVYMSWIVLLTGAKLTAALSLAPKTPRKSA